MFDFFKKRNNKGKEVVERLRKKVTILERATWIPEVRGGDGLITASKFAGIPFIPEGEEWPECIMCKNPMQLFVQLNLAELPALPDGCPNRGFIQLFHCAKINPECDEDNPTFSPGSKSVVLRYVEQIGEGRKFDIKRKRTEFPPRPIITWLKETDYPDWDDLIDHGIRLTDAEGEFYHDHFVTIEGEKLLGWPFWIQGADYPRCPACQLEMHMLFQIDSCKNIPWSFVDSGMAHIMQCPEHPRNLAFTYSFY